MTSRESLLHFGPIAMILAMILGIAVWRPNVFGFTRSEVESENASSSVLPVVPVAPPAGLDQVLEIPKQSAVPMINLPAVDYRADINQLNVGLNQVAGSVATLADSVRALERVEPDRKFTDSIAVIREKSEANGVAISRFSKQLKTSEADLVKRIAGIQGLEANSWEEPVAANKKAIDTVRGHLLRWIVHGVADWDNPKTGIRETHYRHLGHHGELYQARTVAPLLIEDTR